MIECNLCGMKFPEDSIIDKRCERHTEFHSKAWIQHRNTTQGIPTYLKVED